MRRRASSTSSRSTSGSATKTVVFGMAAAMAIAFVASLVASPSGRAGEEIVPDAQTPNETAGSQAAVTGS